MRPLYYILLIIIIQISIFLRQGEKIEKTKLRTNARVYCFICWPSLEKHSYLVLTYENNLLHNSFNNLRHATQLAYYFTIEQEGLQNHSLLFLYPRL